MKRLLCGLLMLGWIPTLVIVLGARSIAGEPLLAQTRTPIKVTRLFTGADGKTHVEEQEIPLKPQGRGTELSDTVAVAGLQFRTTNQDYHLDFHTAPRRQYVVTLSGESEVELEGGRKIRLGPGHILLAEDTTGQGHISRAVGTADRVSLFITLADPALPRK
jgi:quercetin dioxygenase-like cupin family protein